MIWSKRLFYGEKASKQKFKLIKSISKRSLTPFLYIIAFVDNELCIFSQVIFNSLYYKESKFLNKLLKKNKEKNIIVLGLAISKYEANEVVKNIVHEVYSNTGGFDYKNYFIEREEI